MTTSARLEKIFDEAKKELEDRQKTTRQQGLREGSVAAQQRPLLQDADFYESELHDFEEALKGAEGRRKDAQKKIRSTTNNLKKAEAWLRDASARWFIPASVEAQADLAKEWNAAAREMFGLEIIDEAELLTSGRSLDASLLEIRDGFGEEIARLEDEIVEQENVDTDASDEIATVQADIKSTQRDIETTNYELDRITEKGLTEEGVEARLGSVPDLEGLDSKEKDEAIVKWLMEGDDPELSFDEELQDLVDSDEITAGLPRVRQLMRDNEQARTRERVSSGERLLRDTEGSPEAVRRAAVTDAAREIEEPFSPERVRREAAQDRRERTVEREREEVPFGDPEGFGTVSREVLEEDEPFSPERMRRANVFREDADPISRRMVGAGVGGPLEAGERDKFRGPFGEEEEEEEEEEETVEIVDDDDDGDGDTTTTTTTTDGDADADADLTSAATATFILENFGLTSFFLDRDDMLILNPETGEEVNVLQYIEDTGKTNDEEVLGLISQTKWYQNTGPTSRAFERDWSVAGKAGRAELLDETSDLISREAKKIGLTLTEDQLYSLSFNAKMMGMDDYEIRQEFVDNWELSFDSEAVQSGNIAALRNKVNQAAGKYMLLLDDDALATAAESLYLGETSLDGLEAGFRNQAIGQMPELGNLIKQGYTPQMYFSSYKTQAERLLERKIDFLGDDRNMFINVMGGQTDDTFIQKPLTLTQANRYFRGLDEWKYTKNARQEARGMADQVGRMFGAVA